MERKDRAVPDGADRTKSHTKLESTDIKQPTDFAFQAWSVGFLIELSHCYKKRAQHVEIDSVIQYDCIR